MPISYYVIDFFVIMLACMAAAWCEHLFMKWKNRRLDLGCDSCKEVVQLARTPDKQSYLCRTCYSAYVTEHFPNLDPNLKKIFRKIRRKR